MDLKYSHTFFMLGIDMKFLEDISFSILGGTVVTEYQL